MGYLDKYTKRVQNISQEELEHRLQNDVFRTPSNVGQMFGKITNEFINHKFRDSTTYRNALVFRNNENFDFLLDVRILDVQRMGSIRQILLRPVSVNNLANIPPERLQPISSPYKPGDRWIQKILQNSQTEDILVNKNNWENVRGEFLVNTRVFECIREKTENEEPSVDDWKLITNGIDKKEIVQIGDLLYFDDDYWLVYDSSGSMSQGIKLEVQRVNNKLRWVDRYGKYHVVRALVGKGSLGSKSQLRAGTVEVNPYGVNLQASMIRGFVEYNESTKLLDIGHRFVVGSNVYKIVSIDDTSYMNYEAETGILQLIMDIDTVIPEKDNFETGVAYNKYEADEGRDGIDEAHKKEWGW